MAGTTILWPVAVLLGAVLGIASSSLGIGAGLIAVPVLFGLYEIPFPIAVGSSLALVTGNAAVGMIGHTRRGNVDLKLGLLLGGGIALGALAGGWILDRLSRAASIELFGHTRPLAEVVGASLFSVLLLALGIFTTRDVRRTVTTLRAGGDDAQEIGPGEPLAWLAAVQFPPRIGLQGANGAPVSVWPLVAVSLLSGICAGLLGVGGGFLLVPVLLYWFRTRTLLAVGTSLAGILVGTLLGTVQKGMLGVVDWSLVAVLFSGGLVGIPLGIRLASRVPPHELRRAYAIVCFVGVALSLSKLLR